MMETDISSTWLLIIIQEKIQLHDWHVYASAIMYFKMMHMILNDMTYLN